MEVCSFSFMSDIPCGPNDNISPESKWLPIRSCDGNILSHLRASHISISTIKSEFALIKARSGYFELTEGIDDHIICPNHRFHLGKGFRRRKVCMSREPLTNCCHKHQASDTTVSLTQSQQIYNQYGILIPVGSGFCCQCRVKLCNSLKDQVVPSHDDTHDAVEETEVMRTTILTASREEQFQEPTSYTRFELPVYETENLIHVSTNLTEEYDEPFSETSETGLELHEMHVMKGSDVADHCCRFALSDGTKDYSSSCDHPHSNSCKQCEDLEVVLYSLKETSNNVEYENDDQMDDTIYTVSESVRAIQEWKKHVLRTVNQDMARKTVLENLKDNEVLIERDWAMKFIPMQYRESQASWFGKRGLNWHITVATFKIKSSITSHTIIHIFDSAAQDAETSNAIQSNCFDILSNMKPCLDTAFIRSDNAGCFHGSVSVGAAPYLSSRIRCARMDFADPQGGKSICDRKAAHTKSYIRRYVNEGNDVCTASDFKDAVMKMNMKNVSVIVALPPTKNASKKQRTIFKLPKITTLNNFCFTEEGCVRVWRHRGRTHYPCQWFMFCR